jgi:hypothetical protein
MKKIIKRPFVLVPKELAGYKSSADLLARHYRVPGLLQRVELRKTLNQ